ncbi:MAG: hypothetical protein DMH00_00035 [Acidobacteria bacterium]|nr:MAG: hypothetical protein DMH00_00035 [Acidobacteriota bacterium]
MQRCRRPGSRRVQGSALRGFVALLALVLLVSTGAGAKSSAAASARVESDLPYVPGGGPKQQLDLYLPASRNFPSLLFVHGGSLSAGDRKEDPYLHVCEPIREAGIGCASISYRLFPLVGWPAPVQDVASAFAWLKQNIRSRGGDPERLFLAGHSSGCMLVALVGADPKYLETHGLMPRDVAGGDRHRLPAQRPAGYQGNPDGKTPPALRDRSVRSHVRKRGSAE